MLSENYIKVENDANLVRDKRTKAILNVNVEAHKGHRAMKERQRRLDESMEVVATLKEDVKVMGAMLQIILEKLNEK